MSSPKDLNTLNARSPPLRVAPVRCGWSLLVANSHKRRKKGPKVDFYYPVTALGVEPKTPQLVFEVWAH